MKHTPLSETLATLPAYLTTERVSIRQLMTALPDSSLEIILLLFSLIIALPLPFLPGAHTILAIPLLLITLQQISGRRTVWLPRFILDRSTTHANFEKINAALCGKVKYAERLLRPRLGFLIHAPARRLAGLCGFIMAVTVAVPFPFTNTVPSLCISIMAIGFIMHDGLAILLGALCGLGWCILLALLGGEGVTLLADTVRNWL